MNKTSATNHQLRQDMKGRARASLMDSMYAVQASMAATPTVIPFPKNLSEAFLAGDNILAMINKQIMDARSQMDPMLAMFGMDDPMVEAMAFQMAALEKAYAERLALLKKKREEATRQLKTEEILKLENSLTDVRRKPQPEKRKNYGTLWLWAVLLLADSRKAKTKYGLVPNAA